MIARPAIPSPPHRGRCLCGDVHYVLDARPLAVNACHCHDCKKLAGATHIVTLVGPRDAFRHLSGEVERYRKRADSGREIDLVRCARCGVRLWQESLSSPEFIFIAAGTLDDSGWAVPASHIWTKCASPGIRFEPDAVLVEGQPGTRQIMFDAFARAYSRLA